MSTTDIERGPQASFFKASAAMVALSLLLFWLPFLGPAIAGLVGGYLAGTIGRALLASIVPAILVAVLVGLVGTLFADALGAIAGGVVFLIVLGGDIPLFLGAIVGAIVSARR